VLFLLSVDDMCRGCWTGERIDGVLGEGARDRADRRLMRGGLGIIIERGLIEVGGIEGRKEREGKG
jgi:hypothetical protein